MLLKDARHLKKSSHSDPVRLKTTNPYSLLTLFKLEGLRKTEIKFFVENKL
jgi:hypothetical protein